MLISCQQNLAPEMAYMPDGDVMTKSLSSVGKVGPDDPIIFLSEDDSLFWSQTVTLEDRFIAFNMSSSRLDQMTTTALVKSIMNYPLNYLILASSNPEYAINLVVEKSQLHKELLSRSDAPEVFVDLYVDTELDMSVEKSNYDGDYKHLSIANMLFIEYFLGLEVLDVFCKTSLKQKLAEAINKNFQDRVKITQTSDTFLLQSLLTVNDNLSLGLSLSENIETRVLPPTATIHTVFNQTLYAFIYEELESTILVQVANNLITAHPNAIVRGSATKLYNGNSYAWSLRSINNSRWLPSTIVYNTSNSEFQLQKYWTNDLYVACSAEEAEIAYFPDAGHSAVKLSNGKYMSKWEAGPLMEHDLEDCPYYSSNVEYYKERDTPLTGALTIVGQSPVRINQSYTYSVQERLPSLTFGWEVRFMDAPSPAPFVLTENNKSCSLVCEDYGLFKTLVYGYYNGRIVASGLKDVIALPDEYVTQ